MIVPLRFVLGLIVAAGALLLIALTGGGWWVLDRLDPLLAVPGAGLAAMLGAMVAGRMRWWVALLWGVLTTVALTAAAIGPAYSILPLRARLDIAVATPLIAFAVFVALAAVSLSSLLPRWRRTSLLLITLVIAGLWQSWSWSWIVPLYDIPPTNRSALLVSSLPLIDPTGRSPPEAFVERLRAATRLTVKDDVSEQDLARTDVLILAHPRALTPQQLVSIDAWIRRGGDAVILADGLLVWPARWPLGDPRNPPVTSLLTPLLSHWGIRLDAPEGLRVRAIQTGTRSSRLNMIAPGKFVIGNEPPAGVRCHVLESEHQRLCEVARGVVLLLSDADMLQESLWQGAPRSHRGASTMSDNVDWMLSFIGRRDREPDRRPIWWHCDGCTIVEVM